MMKMSRLIECKTGWRSVNFDEKMIEECAKGGIEVLENDCCWNDCSCADYDYTHVQNLAKTHGIYLQSVHLALGDTIDISLDDTKDKGIEVIRRQIYHAGEGDVKYGVLHASAEPIADNERNERMKTALESIETLADYAQKCGVTLCIEDLPRSCLCNDIDEMSEILQSDERLKVCFDVNHLLKCTHEQFINEFGDKIVTTHISDYDFLDDRHWIPGFGKIDWANLADLLEKADYSGAFLFECDVESIKGEGYDLGYDAYRKIHENIAARRDPLFELK